MNICYNNHLDMQLQPMLRSLASEVVRVGVSSSGQRVVVQVRDASGRPILPNEERSAGRRRAVDGDPEEGEGVKRGSLGAGGGSPGRRLGGRGGGSPGRCFGLLRRRPGCGGSGGHGNPAARNPHFGDALEGDFSGRDGVLPRDVNLRDCDLGDLDLRYAHLRNGDVGNVSEEVGVVGKRHVVRRLAQAETALRQGPEQRQRYLDVVQRLQVGGVQRPPLVLRAELQGLPHDRDEHLDNLLETFDVLRAARAARHVAKDVRDVRQEFEGDVQEFVPGLIGRRPEGLDSKGVVRLLRRRRG